MNRFVFYAESNNGKYFGTIRAEDGSQAKEWMLRYLKDEYDADPITYHEIIGINKETQQILKLREFKQNKE